MKDSKYSEPVKRQEIWIRWQKWLAANAVLTAKIVAERIDDPVDVDMILADNRDDLDERHDYLLHD